MNSNTATIFGALGSLAVFALPIVAGVLLIVFSRKRGRGFPACGACGYNVSASLPHGARCPECGADFLFVGILPPSGFKNSPMKWCGIALVLVPPTCLGFVGLNGYLTMRAIQAQQQARLAAAAQQMSVLGQQTKLLGMSADPVQVQQHVDRIQGLSRQEWQSRLVSLNEEQSRLLQEGRIDEQTAAAIVAEREALLQCLTGRLDSPNPQRAKSDSNTSQPESEGTAAFEFPPPITAEQVMAMTKEEARAALFERAVAEKQEADDETRDRIVRERKMLLEFFKGNAPTSQPATMAAAATSPAAPLDAPPPLTAQQINAMSTAEARAALYERAIAERRNRAYPDVVERLKQERRLLIERLKQRDP